MSNLNIANLPRITPQTLRSLLLSPQSSKKVAVIDVRDSDYIGGHITQSTHAPTSTHDTAMPELVRTFSDRKLVVFTCMLSQQRGPSSALRYGRERERLLKSTSGAGKVANADLQPDGDAEAEEQDDWAGKVLQVLGEGEQIVAALQGGFQGWVLAGFGGDERVTEGFRREVWEDVLDD